MTYDKSEQTSYLKMELNRLREASSKMSDTDPMRRYYDEHIQRIEEFLGDDNGQTTIKDLVTAKEQLKTKYDLRKILDIDNPEIDKTDIRNYIGNGISIQRY